MTGLSRCESICRSEQEQDIAVVVRIDVLHNIIKRYNMQSNALNTALDHPNPAPNPVPAPNPIPMPQPIPNPLPTPEPIPTPTPLPPMVPPTA